VGGYGSVFVDSRYGNVWLFDHCDLVLGAFESWWFTNNNSRLYEINSGKTSDKKILVLGAGVCGLYCCGVCERAAMGIGVQALKCCQKDFLVEGGLPGWLVIDECTLWFCV
jgi:hypothetical protein